MPSTVTLPSAGVTRAAIACKAVLLPTPLSPVRTVTRPGGTVAVSRCGDMPSRPATDSCSKRIVVPAAATVRAPTGSSGVCPINAKALSAAVLPSCAAWNSTPTRRSGQNTSGASSSAVRPAARVISPYTSRRPTLTATSATPRVAISSSTSADRNATRNVAIAERRCAALSSAILSAGPSARPRARKVGMPAIRSIRRDRKVVIAAMAAADRSAVARPISTMNTGISGSAIRTINAACRSLSAMTTTVAGVSAAARNRAGR